VTALTCDALMQSTFGASAATVGDEGSDDEQIQSATPGASAAAGVDGGSKDELMQSAPGASAPGASAPGRGLNSDEEPPAKSQRLMMGRTMNAQSIIFHLKNESRHIRSVQCDPASVATLVDVLSMRTSVEFDEPDPLMVGWNNDRMEARRYLADLEDGPVLLEPRSIESHWFATQSDLQSYRTWPIQFDSAASLELFCDVVDALTSANTVNPPGHNQAPYTKMKLQFGSIAVHGGFNGVYSCVNAFHLPVPDSPTKLKAREDQRNNRIAPEQTKCIFPVSAEACKMLCNTVSSWKVVHDMVLRTLQSEFQNDIYDLVRADVLFMYNKTAQFTCACTGQPSPVS